MLEWAYLFKIGIALFAIVNPIGSVPIFISATEGWSRADRARIAKTVAFTVFLVLSLSAMLGDKILAFFSISIPSFQVGGGILLILIAISMTSLCCIPAAVPLIIFWIKEENRQYYGMK